jgi:hypothetical protein
LTKFDISDSFLSAEGGKMLAEALNGNQVLTSLDISNQADHYGKGGIGVEGAKHLAGALKDHT